MLPPNRGPSKLAAVVPTKFHYDNHHHLIAGTTSLPLSLSAANPVSPPHPRSLQATPTHSSEHVSVFFYYPIDQSSPSFLDFYQTPCRHRESKFEQEAMEPRAASPGPPRPPMRHGCPDLLLPLQGNDWLLPRRLHTPRRLA